MTFEEFWLDCLSMANTQRQREIMSRLKNLYHDYWEEGKTPEQVMESEWG